MTSPEFAPTHATVSAPTEFRPVFTPDINQATNPSVPRQDAFERPHPDAGVAGEATLRYRRGEAAEIARTLVATALALGHVSLIGAARLPRGFRPIYSPESALTNKIAAAQPVFDRTPKQEQSLRGLFDTLAARRTTRSSRSFDLSFSDIRASFDGQPRVVHRPVPQPTFSHQEAAQKPREQQPYTPQFDLRFSDAGFSPGVVAEARKILAETAREKNASPSDPLARFDIARAAMRRAHPDQGGNPEVAKVINRLVAQENDRPGVREAKAARRAQRQAEEAASPPNNETPKESVASQAPTTETPASPPQESIHEATPNTPPQPSPQAAPQGQRHNAQ